MQGTDREHAGHRKRRVQIIDDVDDDDVTRVTRVTILGNKVQRCRAPALHYQSTQALDVGPARMQRAYVFAGTEAAKQEAQLDSTSTVLASKFIRAIDLKCHETMHGMYEMDGVPMDGVPEDGMPETDGRRNEPSQPSCTAVATSTTLAEISRILSFSKTCTTLAEILLTAWLNKHEEALDANGMPSHLTIATCLSLSYKWLGEYSGTQCKGHDAAAALRHMNHTGAYQETKSTQVPCSRVFSAIWLVVQNSINLGEFAIHDMHARNKHNGINSNMRFIERKILRAINWNFRQFEDEVWRRTLDASIYSINR